jgi:hypothetical protein
MSCWHDECLFVLTLILADPFKGKRLMKVSYLSALAVAATVFAGSASAVPVTIQFNVAALGAFTANTGDVTTALTITNGAPNLVGFIQQDNLGLVAGQAVTLAPNPMGVTLGSVFTKTFTTAAGTFVETLTVDSVTPGPNSLGVLASGSIVQTVGVGFDPTPVFWSAAYTQNQGPGTQINGSFNNSTTRLTIPEPGSLALAGLALAGLAAARRRKAA